MANAGTRREVGKPVLTPRKELDQLIEQIEWERRHLREENALLKLRIRWLDEQPLRRTKAMAAGAK